MSIGVIFDMDGVLIDSEPMWKASEKSVFSKLGVNVEDHLTELTAKMTTSEVAKFWYSKQPWPSPSLKQVENLVINSVIENVRHKGSPILGVVNALERFKEAGFKIGLATNSPAILIEHVLCKLDIQHYFDAVSSADEVKSGKPNPSVYLTTAEKLSLAPDKCVAIEDSISGLMAAIGANMRTVAVPYYKEFHNKKFEIADIKIRNLNELCLQTLAKLF